MVNIAVIGAGVIGLTTAIEIQKTVKNASVTIIAEKLSPHTTGDLAAGLWGPYLLGDTPEGNVLKWSKITHDKFFELWRAGLATIAGISLQTCVRVVTEDGPYQEPFWISVPYGKHKFTEEQLARINKLHNKTYTGGNHYVTFTCEPTKLLPFLLEQYFQNGGDIVIKKVNSFDEFTDFDTVVNCTGPGAKELLKDNEMHLIRGQVTRVRAQWQYEVIQDESEDGNYIIPNMTAVILGGTHQVDDTNTVPDPADKERILKGCFKMSPGLQSSTEIVDGVGLRPGRSSVRLEAEKYITGNNRVINIVHNYGHSGSGVTLCFGCAIDAAALVQSVVSTKMKSHL